MIPLTIMDRHGFETADCANYELLKPLSKGNRRNATSAEYVKWSILRRNALGVHFRRQHIIGEYIADFVCLSHRLIVETDGLYHEEEQQRSIYAERTERLSKRGYTAIRFTNHEVMKNRDKVATTIKEYISNYDANR